MKFLQVNGKLNPNICYTLVVVTTNFDIIMTSVVKTLEFKKLKNYFFIIISGCSVNCTKQLLYQ